MYIFITIIFIAELIIALNLILWIMKADKKVQHVNACVVTFKPLAQTYLQYVRCKITAFNESFGGVFTFIRKKQEQFISKTVIMLAIYSLLFIFKIRAKKASKIYKMISVIRDLAMELTV